MRYWQCRKTVASVYDIRHVVRERRAPLRELDLVHTMHAMRSSLSDDCIDVFRAQLNSNDVTDVRHYIGRTTHRRMTKMGVPDSYLPPA